ncbi:MAG: hypothetical protein V4657_01220 [Pseudomonadota bacterium]
MAISTYAELLTEFEAYLNRTDFSTRFPTFVRLVESDVQKTINDDPNMFIRSTATSQGRYTALPDDFGQMIAVDLGGSRMASVTAADFAALDDISGDPTVFAIIGNEIALAPSNTTGTITMIYKQNIPALTVGNTTNWLLEKAPEVYLYGTLLHASAFGWDDNRVPLWQAAYADAVETLQIDGERRRWGAAPLAPRIRRT